MATKLLQWLGALFVVLLVGAAVGGLLVCKDRVRIVVQDDARAMGPDPTALLRDDVQVLANGLAELQAALAANFERLGTAVEERASVRHADVTALREELAATRQRLDGLAQQVAALQSQALQSQALQSQALQSQLAQLPPAMAPQPLPAPETPRVEDAQAPIADQVVAAAPVVPAPEAATAKGKTGSGFLSFSLPETRFRFDESQDYALVPELCRVGFDGKSTLHDFTGVTSKVAGRFTADFDDPDGAWSGEVTAEAGTLLTGVDDRDAGLREHLDTEHHPQIRFTIERFLPAPDGVDVKKQTARGEVRGRMTIRGQTRELGMPLSIEVDPQKRVVVTGQARLKLSDYGVPVPSQLGLINMQDEVVVWVALRARLQARVRK